tara:strand:- start:1210 stop:1794 length:585 start_codon:yes stop_codon:yes gene_type:complete
MKNNTESPRVYVGSYKKYNEGSIFGKWFDLEDYSDQEEYTKALQEHHKKEYNIYNDIEFMAQDWENLPDCCVCDGWVWSGVWDVLEGVDADKLEAFWSWFGDSGHGHNLTDETDAQDIIEQFNDVYIGHFEYMDEVLGWVEEQEAENYHLYYGEDVYNSAMSNIFNCVNWESVWNSDYRHSFYYDDKTGSLTRR